MDDLDALVEEWCEGWDDPCPFCGHAYKDCDCPGEPDEEE